MESSERAIRRERRILGRAVRRGEQPASAIMEFESRHPAIFPQPEPEPKTPFMLPDGRPVDLRGLYRGGAVFIVLSGPSLKTLDLSLLSRRGIVTFGVNNSPAIVRTNLWTHVDPVRKFHDGIWLDPACLKFVPSRFLQRTLCTRDQDGKIVTMTRRSEDTLAPVRPCDCPAVVGYERNAYFNPPLWLQEHTINWGNSRNSARHNKNIRSLNTMFAVLKIAYVLGFRIVYLLGCDFTMSSDEPYAFQQIKNSGAVAANNNGFHVMEQMFRELKPRFDQAGFSVFNCNPNSGLTIFPFVNYRRAIESATNLVPQDPLRTDGWYE